MEIWYRRDNGLEPLISRIQSEGCDTEGQTVPGIVPKIGSKVKWGNVYGNIADQTDLKAILDELQREIEEGIVSGKVFVYKGQVPTYNDLPNDAKAGDVWDVADTGYNYVWSGESWDNLSSSVDLSEYAKIDDVTELINQTVISIQTELQSLDDKKADTSYVIELNNSVVDGVNAEINARKNADTNLQNAINKVADDLADHIADADQNAATKQELADAVSTLEQADSGLDGRLDTLEAKDTVEYTDISSPENPNRKAIVFKNHDGVFGKDTDGNTRNIAMISKYNVADFGTSHLHTNLNTQQIVTVNDNQAVLTDKNLNNILKAGDNVEIEEELVTDPTTGFQFKTYTVNAELSGTSHRIDEIAEELEQEIQDRADADTALDTRVTALEQGATTIFHYKGSKATVAELEQVQNPQVGDVWNVEETGANYAWSGTEWDKLSETIDLTPFLTKEEFNTEKEALQEDIDGKASQSDLEDLQDTVDNTLAHQDGNIQNLLLQMDTLEKKIEDLKSLDYEVVTFYDGGETEYNNPVKDFQLSGAITSPAIITSNSVTLKESTMTATYMDLYADNDVTVKQSTFSGSVPKATSNAIMRLRANGYITIRDYNFTIEKAYNAIECNLSEAIAKSIVIDNVDFDGPLSNNAINVFGMANGGVVTIANCHFKKVSNMLRLSNRLNTTWTINIINCTVDEWETGDYAGAIILQDYTSKTQEEVATRNEFHNLTINIQNLTKPDGTKLVPCDLATICGTKNNNQIIYVYDSFNGVRAYDSSIYPTINIQ